MFVQFKIYRIIVNQKLILSSKKLAMEFGLCKKIEVTIIGKWTK